MAKANPFLPGQEQTAFPKAAAPAAAMPGNAAASSADSFEVDLTNTSGGYNVPDGTYKVRCVEVEQSVSQSGNPMFIWTFTIVEGDQAGKDFKLWTALTPAAMWKVGEVVQALGIGQTGQVVKFKRSDVLNRECGAVIEMQEYNGNERSSISKVISLSDLAAARK